VAGWLAGETLHGNLWRAGLPKGLAPASTAHSKEHIA
jgi:hydroxymethylglutaryl-CoA lyase